MDIVFAGICCWVDPDPRTGGKTVVIPNATGGGTHQGSEIPPHSAFIHAKRHQVEISNWQPDITADDNVMFLLEGDTITFDPVPSGGSIDISALPHVRERITNEPICPAADEFRPNFRHNPLSQNVLGLVDLPPDAPVSTSSNGRGAMFVTLGLGSGPVTITATPFSNPAGARSLKISDSSASVHIANVTIADFLLGAPATSDDHQFLVCNMFVPRSTPSSPNDDRKDQGAIEVQPSELPKPRFDARSVRVPEGASAKPMHIFLSGLAAGCSDSQWP